MDRATWKMVGTGGSAVSSMLGQLLTSAEIEEVRRLLCGALDPEFGAEEDAREVYHLGQKNYRFDVVQIYCFRINIKL